MARPITATRVKRRGPPDEKPPCVNREPKGTLEFGVCHPYPVKQAGLQGLREVRDLAGLTPRTSREGSGRRSGNGWARRASFRGARHVLPWLVSAVACAVFSCANAGYSELRSSNPLDRARGVVKVAQRGDAGTAHRLVELLADDDPAVRMYAILALRRLYGEDHGYRYYDPPAARAAAIERWRAALRLGELPGHASSDVVGPSDTGQSTCERELSADLPVE